MGGGGGGENLHIVAAAKCTKKTSVLHWKMAWITQRRNIFFYALFVSQFSSFTYVVVFYLIYTFSAVSVSQEIVTAPCSKKRVGWTRFTCWWPRILQTLICPRSQPTFLTSSRNMSSLGEHAVTKVCQSSWLVFWDGKKIKILSPLTGWGWF